MMDQLFKCQTIKQRKVMEWLVAQGITSQDVASAKLIGSAMVRVTNPAGQYMDLYCDNVYDVRILQVTAEREDELDRLWGNETADPETEEWREDLNADETAMVEQWDEAYSIGFSRMVCDILEKERNSQPTPSQDWEPEI